MIYYLTLERKEILSHATWMKPENRKPSEMSQSQKVSAAWPHLQEVPGVVTLVDTESKIMAARFKEEGTMKASLMGGVSVLPDGQFLEMGGTTMWMCLTLPSCTFRNG